ncbi:11413_t:CDS:2, partial [Gigaspora rosea]
KVVWTKEAKTAKCKSCDHNPFSCGDNGTTKPLWQYLESASAGTSTEVNNIKLRNMFTQLVKADMLKNTIMALYFSGKQELK